MTWARRRVLVTGAGGFIASHLTERLVTLGAVTRAFVHYHALGTWGWLDRSSVKSDMEVVAGDIRDRDSITQAMDGVDVVFHLAALIAIPYSYQAPVSYVHTNVEGTVNVLQAARAKGTARVVHTSTSEVYGTARTGLIDETHPLQAQSPYAASKIAADKMAEAFGASFGVPVVTVRPFNTFGPRQSARAVVPTIITQCLTSDTVRLGNVHPTRDLNFVSDIVEGFLAAGAAPDAVGRVINIGSGRDISIGDLVGVVSRLAGRHVTIVSESMRTRPDASEVERLIADNTLARRLLGWHPTVTLEDGLQRTMDWVQSHLEDFRVGTYAV